MSSIIFLDSRVQDYERLIAGLAPDVQVVILDPGLDGVTQIAEALAGFGNLDSIHIISHGSSGKLYLGSTVLTEDNLDDYEAELTLIGASLSDEGDVLLYGCNVGAGETGESFIASLADYTGADVAASDDVTGSAALGGNWVLEVKNGMIDSSFPARGDTWRTYAYTLDTFTGTTGDDSLSGTVVSDALWGDTGNDSLDGGPGADTLYGGAGNDYLDGGAGDDSVLGGIGDDYFIGGATYGNDTLIGGAGDDVIWDARGDNVLKGGDGADEFVVFVEDSGVTTAVGGAGQDEYRIAFAGLSGYEYQVTDFAAGVGGDVIDVDALLLLSAESGGYVGGNPFDPGQGYLRLVQSGADTLLQWDRDGAAGTSYSWQTMLSLKDLDKTTLTSDNFAGKLIIGTEADDTLIGGIGNDTIQGLSGSDILDGLLGADSMEGGSGDDVYYVDDANDEVIEADPAPVPGEPTAVNIEHVGDTVIASISYALKVNFENLELAEDDRALTGTGNAAGNAITGNSLINFLYGLGGNDTLEGGAGADGLSGGAGVDTVSYESAAAGVTVSLVTGAATGGGGADQLDAFERMTGSRYADRLIGDEGNNVLDGLRGQDTLTGGEGADKFVFSTVPGATNADSITNFVAADDTIQLDRAVFKIALGELAAGAFYEGTAAHDANDRIIYNTNTGALYYDEDGMGDDAAVHFATLLNAPSITAADFFIVA